MQVLTLSLYTQSQWQLFWLEFRYSSGTFALFIAMWAWLRGLMGQSAAPKAGVPGAVAKQQADLPHIQNLTYSPCHNAPPPP